MVISISGKDYIARNFGINNCFAASGLTWTTIGTDGSTATQSGGTASIVGQLVTTAVVSEIRITSPHTGTYTYAQLKAANNGQDITLPEVASEIVDVTYCAGTTPPPTTGITTSGKDYIATNFGVNNCFTPSGLVWTVVGTDGSSTTESGGTASIVGQLVTTAVVSEIRITSPHTGTYTYAQLKAANNGQDITLPMVSSEIVGVTYCASAAPPTPTPPEPGNGVYVEPSPPPTGYAQFRLCTVPGGAHPVVDDVVRPEVTYACSELNPRWIGINVDYTKDVKIAFERLPDFRREDNIAKPKPGQTYWTSLTDGEVIHIRHGLIAAPGAAMGTLQLFARDAETGEYLSARPNINGISGEEKWLLLAANGVKIPLPCADYEITVTHPGYDTPERIPISITEAHTDTNPYSLTFDMHEVRIWKIVEVREKAFKAAWIVSFDIESPVIWEVQSSGSITFEFLQEAAYRCYFALHPLPANWTTDFNVADLAPPVKVVFAHIDGDYTKEVGGETLQYLNPILHTNRRYKANFEMIIEYGEVPAGYYIAVAAVEMWRE